MAWRPFNHLGLKIAAFGLSVLLWITVSGQQVQRNVLVQLQFRNIPASLEMTGDTPRIADVRVRGAAGLISQLEPGQVVATLNLTAARPGIRVFPLTAEQISVPLGVEVLSVDPTTVSLTLEKSASVQVPLKPTVDGQPAPGYDVGETTWTPKSIEIVGPESRLKERPSAITERISIDGATATIVETVNIGVSDSAFRLRQPQSAQVTITIVPGPVARFPGRRVEFRNLPAGREVAADPAVVAVTVRGTHTAVAALGGQQLMPWVDVARLGPGRYTLAVHLDAHDDYIVTAIEPASVSVRIQ
jgi:YbbR domain-containing protein